MKVHVHVRGMACSVTVCHPVVGQPTRLTYRELPRSKRQFHPAPSVRVPLSDSRSQLMDVRRCRTPGFLAEEEVLEREETKSSYTVFDHILA